MREPIHVYFSYAHQDEPLLRELEAHLSVLLRSGAMQMWTRRRISGGDNVQAKVSENLEQAQLVLLLVSADFLANDDCHAETQRALERQRAGEVHVIPIIARGCDWGGAPFDGLQVLPLDGTAVMGWTNYDDGWTEVAMGVRAVVENIVLRGNSAPGARGRSVREIRPPTVRTISRKNRSLKPGDRVAEYTITRLLGAGASAEVWAARDESTNRRVAIKFLNWAASKDPDARRRFKREARIASLLESPYICRMIEAFESSDCEYLVFERLVGETLGARLRIRDSLHLIELGPLVNDVLLGLDAAHRAGVIHRSLKPDDIFIETLPADAPRDDPLDTFWSREETSLVEPCERGKILDFGISKITRTSKHASTLTNITGSGKTFGSIYYTSPEQLRVSQEQTDARSDLYALGVIIFHALSGRFPFEGTSDQVLIAKVTAQVPPLRKFVTVPWLPAVERFLACLLAHSPEKRFGSASEALRAWRSLDRSTSWWWKRWRL